MDGGKVRSLTESMSGSDRKLVFELCFDYPNQLVIATGGLTR